MWPKVCGHPCPWHFWFRLFFVVLTSLVWNWPCPQPHPTLLELEPGLTAQHLRSIPLMPLCQVPTSCTKAFPEECSSRSTPMAWDVQQSHVGVHILLAMWYTWCHSGKTVWKSHMCSGFNWIFLLSAEMCCPSRCSSQRPSLKPQHTGSWRPSHTWDKVQWLKTSHPFQTKLTKYFALSLALNNPFSYPSILALICNVCWSVHHWSRWKYLSNFWVNGH